MGSDRLDEIRARWAAATPGPWRQDQNPEKLRDADGDTFVRVISGCDDHGVVYWTEQNQRDATAIAAAPEDVAWLVAEVERLRGLLAEPSEDMRRLTKLAYTTHIESVTEARWFEAVGAILADLRERAGGGDE